MLSFTNLLVVMAIAFAAPLLLGLFPRVQLPSVVLEIVAGIALLLVGLGALWGSMVTRRAPASARGSRWVAKA